MSTPNNTPTSKKRSTLRNGLAGAAIGAAALVGGVTVLPSLAGAQDAEPETPETEAPETEAEATESASSSGVLAELVEEGVITQEQADTIAERFEAARGERGQRSNRNRVGSEVLTELLGLSQAEIREAFQDGSTLADLAEAQGVATDDLVDALVAEAEERVNEKLEAGDITQEQADTRLDGIEEKIEAAVTTERPAREGRRGRSGAATAEAPDA